jgi:hypothetical protein
MCHGEQGQGRTGADLAQGFSSIDPQQYVRATVAQGIDNTAMPAWSQSNGGPLTESEIDDISAFIVNLPSQAQPTPAPAATPVPADTGGGTNWLVILLVLVVVVVVILLIIAFSGRGGETT